MRKLSVFQEMTEEFQCPGCVAGSDTECGLYKFDEHLQSCSSHVLGTSLNLVIHIALGLPKGFCRSTRTDDNLNTRNQMQIRFHDQKMRFGWDNFNVAVWALEQDGYLFVRTYSPRIDVSSVDVIKGGKLTDAPGAIDVSTFIEGMD